MCEIFSKLQNDVLLMSLLLTLNRFDTFFWGFSFKHVNTCWVIFCIFSPYVGQGSGQPVSHIQLLSMHRWGVLRTLSHICNIWSFKRKWLTIYTKCFIVDACLGSKYPFVPYILILISSSQRNVIHHRSFFSGLYRLAEILSMEDKYIWNRQMKNRTKRKQNFMTTELFPKVYLRQLLTEEAFKAKNYKHIRINKHIHT